MLRGTSRSIEKVGGVIEIGAFWITTFVAFSLLIMHFQEYVLFPPGWQLTENATWVFLPTHAKEIIHSSLLSFPSGEPSGGRIMRLNESRRVFPPLRNRTELLMNHFEECDNVLN